MKNIIVFSGHYDVKNNGSTKEVDENLVKYIDLDGYQVIWIGVGVNKKLQTKLPNIIIDINEGFLLLKIISKTLHFLRKFNLISNSNLQYSLFVLYDYFFLRCVSKRKIIIDQSILVVRNGAATRFISKFKKRGLKVIIHAQWLHPVFQKENVERAYLKLGINFIQKSSKLLKRQKLDFLLTDKIWTFSELGARTFINEGIDKDKILIQNLGANKNKFYFRKATKREGSKRYKLLFVGNISPEKGVDFFLEYLLKMNSLVTDITFLGKVESNFKDYFFNQIAELKRIGINCEVKFGKSYEEYVEADLLVLPSVHDSFGLVISEALMSGLPAFVSTNSGASELIKNHCQGDVFNFNNMEEFAGKIKMLHKKKSFFMMNRKKLSQESQFLDWENVYIELSEKIRHELL